jgi:2-C-methyl-D-erythritol 2,4-cyclodiphosphate synthase
VKRLKVGLGYDVHPLVEGRRLILGGVTIAFPKGLQGHSDADVLVHAVCDALLGAAGLGDIGMHFPDTDPQYKDIASLNLLARVGDMVRAQGFRIHNIDTIVLAQAPKLDPHREAMRANIAQAIHLSETAVNIKATTTEGLGFIGRSEGIGALCVAMLDR